MIPQFGHSGSVHSDSSIRERFLRVEKMAKRTAMVDSESKSLMMYLLSYLQSLFILDPSTHELPSKVVQVIFKSYLQTKIFILFQHVAVDVDGLSTFDLVWLARGSLDRGDLDQAVRYVSMLK